MNYELLTKQVCNLSRSVGKYIKDEVGKLKSSQVKEKGLHDYVTYVDLEAEKRITSELSRFLPGAGFIVEENKELEKADEYNWIVDPLDGTTNFIHGIPMFSVSIALMQGSELVIGVIYEANSQECFYAWKGGGAFLNRNPIQVTETHKLTDALFATGFPYSDYDKLDEYLHFFRDLLLQSRGMRRLGSAALDLAYVACGRFEGFYEYGLKPWDVAAGTLIVKQAGGQVTDFSGGENHLFGKELMATNGALHQALLGMMKKYFG